MTRRLPRNTAGAFSRKRTSANRTELSRVLYQGQPMSQDRSANRTPLLSLAYTIKPALGEKVSALSVMQTEAGRLPHSPIRRCSGVVVNTGLKFTLNTPGGTRTPN